MPKIYRFSRRSVLAVTAAAALCFASLSTSAAEAGAKKKVLYLTQSVGFRHQPVIRKAPDQLASSEVAVIATGKDSGAFEAECTQDATVITPEKLKQIDVLMFYTTGNLPISDANWKAVLDWISSGKGGFIGIHSATDTQWDYKGEGLTYTKFINGQFDGHPWGQGTPETFITTEPSHPTVKMWGPSFDYKEEIYQYKNYDPKAVRVLQYMDMEKTKLKMPYLVPVTWVRSVGEGRMFSTNLGHTPSTWDDPKFREMLVEGVKFVTKQTDGPTEPNPDAQAVMAIHSLLAHAAANGKQLSAEPHALAGKLQGADKGWLLAKADDIEKLRRAGMPQEPRKPNERDKQRDAAKYERDMEKYEADVKAYPAAKEKYAAARDALVDEIVAKAGAGATAAAN
jgi:type 1 glutamine amidotransferase